MLDLQRDSGVAVITLQGDSAWNTLDDTLLRGLAAALHSAVDNGAKAIVLTGAGKVFSAGGDVKAFNALIEEGESALVAAVSASMEELGNPIMRFIAQCPVPVISAVNGPCAGGAFGFALAADVTLCARSAYFLVPQVTQLGVVPDCGVSWVLARALGRPRAMGMTLLGGRLSGEQAQQWGLVWQCVDDEELLAQAMSIAHKLARLPANAITAARQLLDQAVHVEPAVTLAAEREAQRVLIRSEFFRDACGRFAGKK